MYHTLTLGESFTIEAVLDLNYKSMQA